MDSFSLPCCEAPAERIVCRCLGITEEKLIAAIQTGAIRSLRDLHDETGAGSGCTCCHPLLRAYLERYSPVCGSSSSALPICSVR
jgi:bacterioferritin-associated ferredoxin